MAKLFSLGLSLIDNTQSEFPVAVSSLSSLSSKTPITNAVAAEDHAVFSGCDKIYFPSKHFNFD